MLLPAAADGVDYLSIGNLVEYEITIDSLIVVGMA